MKIVIADDEQILLNFLTGLVKELRPNDEIVSFSSTRKLLEEIKHTKFDVAFLDIHMPEITGIELAKELKKSNGRVNIIFVTGFDGYEMDALNLFVSGYVKKPATREKIKAQLDNLRYPEGEEKKRIFAQTFGNFTLFVDGEPISFNRSKTQAVMAYLIHRRGSVVSKKELSCAVFDDGLYDSNRMSYMSKLCADLQKTLQAVNAESLVSITSNGLSVNLDLFDCDLYDFLGGDENAKRKYNGEYMSQYEFGEDMIPILDEERY